MSNISYYKTLELDENASISDVKKAYRRLAMKYHPDRNQGDRIAEEKFKNIKNAYEILTNKKTNPNVGGDNKSDFNMGGFGNFGSSFDDIFGEFFGDYEFSDTDGDYSKKSKKSNLGDIFEKIKISIFDAAKGCKYGCFIPFWSICKSCNGKKYVNKLKPNKCVKCNGLGYLKILSSFLNIRQTCPFCKGYGRITMDSCLTCSGSGKVKDRKYVSFEIPKGVVNGSKIKLKGKGDIYDIKNYLYGDYYFEIYIEKDLIYSLDGDYNVHFNMDVLFIDVLLGFSASIKTLYRSIKINFDSCFDSSKPYRLYGKGYYKSGDSYSDFIIHFNVKFPLCLTRKQLNCLNLIKVYFK